MAAMPVGNVETATLKNLEVDIILNSITMKKALLIAVIGMILNSFQVSIETGGTLPVGGGKKVDASSIDL